MNNEPVAWMVKNRDSGIGYVQTNEPIRMDKVANEYLPLYLHPAKTLTDKEILKCWNETHPAVVMLNAELPLFAKAILRKTQEK